MESSLFRSLTLKMTESETSQVESLIQKIEQHREWAESLSPQEWHAGLQRLSPYRLRSSGTLKRGSREGWIAANTYVAEKVAAEQLPREQDILQINAMMRQQTEASIRAVDVFIGPHKACAPEELPKFLSYYYENMLPLDKHSHPLVAAALSRYWLVSLHPFEDANGRTSVMIADWLLLSRGYLPLSFERKLDAVIGSIDGSRVSATPGQAILKTLRSIFHSYQVVLDKALAQ
ncbi:Fic family protein [Bdellovibrio svalbardensis]|uniref:Fic family protein n=1 Tax=Bdellovibrio svalbardensis TaxID=2972972 RepID=A0ABT6DJR0_9BACT|nr:Fic family protein [Bdellovibrio svalbardensis]MDG0815328.1 Fic family protein [Bdellovibrio svalbardensis]